MQTWVDKEDKERKAPPPKKPAPPQPPPPSVRFMLPHILEYSINSLLGSVQIFCPSL